jgi:hypothetical protein
MQRSYDLSSSRIITAAKSSLRDGVFPAHAAMAFVAIVLLTLTFAAMEAFLSGDESLSALEAAAMIRL